MVKELKGSLPIMAEQKNINNLFKTYWRLRQKQDKSLTKFCQYFGKNVYSNIFNYFNQRVYGLTNVLHNNYMNAFVNKTMMKSDIPFAFKPMCGDLHKLYIESRKPVTLSVVITYINNLPVNKIYWRIFGLDTDDTNCADKTVDKVEENVEGKVDTQ